MGVFGGIVAYLLIWVIVLFMVLPLGVRQPEEPESGHMPGAPDNPRIFTKFLLTSAVAGVLWVLLYFAIYFGVIQLPA